jgi:hypothetical protein
MPLTESAARRLALYCKRARLGPYEHVDRPYPGVRHNVRRVRYVNKRLRELVYSDTEVRNVLLQDDLFDALVQGLGAHRGDLLDLCCAMTLEAERNPRVPKCPAG